MSLAKLLCEIAARCPNQKLPNTYMVIDLETSGSGTPQAGLQYGYCFVRNGKMYDSFAQILDRREVNVTPRAFEVHGITHARIVAEGVAPKDYLDSLVGLMEWWRAQGFMFVGHNMAAFDLPIIEHETAVLAHRPFKFMPDEIIDTGMLVKASRLGMFYPRGKSLRDFYLQVNGVFAKGVKWSLNDYCYDAYNLTKYGVAKERFHDAAHGCTLSHYLLQAVQEAAAQEGVPRESVRN